MGRFSPETIARIRAQTQTVRRLLILADRIDRSVTTSQLHLICDEAGHVLYADECAAAWLTTRRREALGLLLREQEAGAIDGMSPTYGWLDDGHRKLHHVVLSAVDTVHVTPWRHLSDTQRTIVRLALDGLSNAEIARLQGISTSTVKYHISQAARRLDVSGRHGLNAALSDADCPVG